MKNEQGKGASYWIAIVCAILLIVTPVVVIFTPDVGWENVGWAMIVWGVIGFVTGITNMANPK